MIECLRNGVPIKVDRTSPVVYGLYSFQRVGDEGIVDIYSQKQYFHFRQAHVQLLRGPGRKRYLVEVKGLRRWLKDDAQRKINEALNR